VVICGVEADPLKDNNRLGQTPSQLEGFSQLKLLLVVIVIKMRIQLRFIILKSMQV